MILKNVVRLCRYLKASSVKRTGSFMLAVLIIDTGLAFVVTAAYAALLHGAYLGQIGIVAGASIFAGLSMVALPLFRTQKVIWRFISWHDTSTFLAAGALITCAGNVLIAAVQAMSEPRVAATVSIAQFLLYAAVHAGLLAGAWLSTRFAWRVMQDLVDGEDQGAGLARRVLLVSAGVGCDTLLRGLEGSSSPIQPVGILDFDVQQTGRMVRGVAILGSPLDLQRIVGALTAAGKPPQEVVLTASLNQPQLMDVIERAVALKLKVSKLPPPGETSALLNRGLSPTEPITLHALVGRRPFEFDRAPISQLVANKRIIVTGAGGSIGSQLVELIARFGPEQLCLVDNSEFNLWKIEQHLKSEFPDLAFKPRLTDIRDANRLRQLFAEVRPHLVFHAAALKHVPIIETNQAEGVLTNIVGTMNVADAALEAGVEAMVQVSTDKAVMPTSVMGATKRLAEIYCQALDLGQTGPRFMTVRFGNVLGSSGSVVPIFEKQIADGGPVTITHPMMERYFMTIAEASELILHSAAHSARDANARGVINVLDMGDPVRIVDVARRMILLHGLMPEGDIKIEFTGIRPGEKLSEELFNDTETRLESAVPGVHTALSEGVPLATIKRVIASLTEQAHRGDHRQIMITLAEALPGYQAPSSAGSSSEAA